ncbi:MBL fold metallo-hydrolase [Rheinheimera baltica]|uniref:MBL fold metallo-hydrolase n=1 Tax=Rheinheimera baltica TaxID=67576 RepID=A0ABT9I4I7_9GAMM|nr:MBL fold metallo-hydrolase [Rheinheimera baltica]MDP5137866.1 MBL fold metallo-hydrolase [Rheinheimera baltica]MDP5141157.1 MBL fold metallo-hydrolase [Rheinheimera baltica]MDP5148386.1 MBL fold metallo-hydrolase [Rheinheimera baltica]MDP5189152.1 MBL fold metallo-hydrolase [Rheinheimera baltica]
MSVLHTNNQHNVLIEMFFDQDSSTFSYVVADTHSKRAAIIDPVLNYDAAAGAVSTEGADTMLAYIAQQQLSIDWILETHAHADHLSAAHYLKQKTGAPVAIGEGIKKVQQTFKVVFNLGDDELTAKGDYFDKLFTENETFAIGELKAQVINTPGHTNDSVSYLIADNLFVGDSLFMPDSGTARCDFPGGDAHVLFRSIQRIYQLPEQTQIFMCHDYQPGGRELKYQTSVAEQKAHNIHVKADTAEQEFVLKRETRDKTLAVPRLIYPSVQVNIRAGQLPIAAENGVSYIKIPLKVVQ